MAKRYSVTARPLILPKKPESMVVVGSGAIGIEFAYFYNSIGTKVTVVEFLDNIVPLEDEEVSKQLGPNPEKTRDQYHDQLER